MKFVLVSNRGVVMRRDVLSELVRRTCERMPTANRAQLQEAMTAVLAEFETELDTYAASIKE
jgi:hypothetical protein